MTRLHGKPGNGRDERLDTGLTQTQEDFVHREEKGMRTHTHTGRKSHGRSGRTANPGRKERDIEDLEFSDDDEDSEDEYDDEDDEEFDDDYEDDEEYEDDEDDEED